MMAVAVLSTHNIGETTMLYDIIFRKNTTYARKQSEEVVDTVDAVTRSEAVAMWFSGAGAAYTQQYLFSSEDGTEQRRESGSLAWREGDESIDLGDEEVYVTPKD
jgi:hypothetical protein